MLTPVRPALWCWLFAALAFTSLAAEPTTSSTQPWAHEGSDITPSPRVTWGRLENGLRYAIMPNTTPAGHVCLRLLVLSGSLQENENQLGYAHFIEHMAFNGTRHFPTGELLKNLERQGVVFGQHLNATTNSVHTYYSLEFPTNSAELTATGMNILRDCADGILFEPDEIERERGVILSEALARRTPAQDASNAARRFIFDGTLIPERSPIGTEQSVKGATRESLREFYDAWYRPERMIVIATGDFDPTKIDAAVRENFSSLRASGPELPTPPFGQLRETSSVSARHHQSQTPAVTLNLSVTYPVEPEPDSLEKRYDNLCRATVAALINQRLKKIQEAAKSRLYSASIRVIDDEYGSFNRLVVELRGLNSEWAPLLQIAEQEIRRALEHGFEPGELAAIVESQRATCQAQAKAMPTTASSALAGALGSSIEQNFVFRLPDESLASRIEAINRLNVEDCLQAMQELWSRAAPRVFISFKAKEPLSEERIVAAYKASQAVAVKPPAEVKPIEFAYKNFGAPGEVVKKDHIEDLDVWLVRFANGVRLNLKRTDYAKNSVLFSLRLGAGRMTEPANKPGLYQWTPALLVGGLGKHTHSELQRALNGHGSSFAFTAQSDAFSFGGTWRSDDLGLSLRCVTAYFTDPAFRSESERKTKIAIAAAYGALRGTPMEPLTLRVIPFLSGGAPEIASPPYSKSSRHSVSDLKRWLKPVLQTGCIEISLVGDFDVDQAIAEVGRTFGTLPKRVEKPNVTQQRVLKLPLPPKSQRFDFVATNRPASLVYYWPVREQLSTANKAQLQLLSGILQNRLLVHIREELGETYSPRANFSNDLAHPGYAHLSCTLDVNLEKVETIGKAVQELVATLASTGVTEDELARVKAQLLARQRDAQRNNSYWLLSVLQAAQEFPNRLEESRTLLTVVEQTTKAEIDAVATRYLKPENLFQFTLQPKPPAK